MNTTLSRNFYRISLVLTILAGTASAAGALLGHSMAAQLSLGLAVAFLGFSVHGLLREVIRSINLRWRQLSAETESLNSQITHLTAATVTVRQAVTGLTVAVQDIGHSVTDVKHPDSGQEHSSASEALRRELWALESVVLAEVAQSERRLAEGQRLGLRALSKEISEDLRDGERTHVGLLERLDARLADQLQRRFDASDERFQAYMVSLLHKVTEELVAGIEERSPVLSALEDVAHSQSALTDQLGQLGAGLHVSMEELEASVIREATETRAHTVAGARAAGGFTEHAAKGDFDRSYFAEQFRSLRVAAEQAPSDIGEYISLRQELIPDGVEMPALGGWAATVRPINMVVRRVLQSGRALSILECGTGASSLWFGYALQAAGAGHCTSLEHDRDFAARSRTLIEKHGLSDWVTIVDAPLVPYELGGSAYQWYDLSSLPKPLSIDLLFVDGPPAAAGRHARFPAFPLLSSALKDGACVILDDTIRAEEKAILKGWQDSAFGQSIRRVDDLGKATLLQM